MTALNPEVIKPRIDQGYLDGEGRLIVLKFPVFDIINAYIPHYEYHQPRLHQRWMTELTVYWRKLNQRKQLLVAGDVSILLPATTKNQR